MKILNLIVPNYILYIIGIIVVVSAVFLPILFTVILPKLDNTTATSTSTIIATTSTTPPTTTAQPVLINLNDHSDF